MAKFYRVETPQGEGCYEANRSPIFEFEDNGGEAFSASRHPLPESDSKLNRQIKWGFLSEDIKNKYYFGFSSIIQFKSWFYNAELLQLFHEAGYSLSVYDTFTLIDGNAQAVCKLREELPRKIKTISLADFY